MATIVTSLKSGFARDKLLCPLRTGTVGNVTAQLEFQILKNVEAAVSSTSYFSLLLFLPFPLLS